MDASLTVVLTLLIFWSSALPTNIILHRSQRQHNGYHFEYEAEDGSRRQETGTFVYRENESEPVLQVKGMYSYFDGDGREYVVHYEADDKGSKHEGDIVPPLQKDNAAKRTDELP